MELLASASMRLYRIYTRSSGESAIEIREVPMSGPRPTSPAFQAGALFFRETPEGFVHVAMPDDFDVTDWPLATSGGKGGRTAG